MPFLLFLYLISASGLAFAEWKENCQSTYEPIAVAPIISWVITAHEQSTRADAKALEDRLRQSLVVHAKEQPAVWNSADIQDLGREVQEFLFQQKPDAAIDPLRSHWIILLIAQKQWDLLVPVLKNQQGPWTHWEQAETRFGRQEYAEAQKLFAAVNHSALKDWLELRRMETLFLSGQSEAALEPLVQVMKGPLLSEPAVTAGFINFLQAYSGRGQNLRPLLARLKESGREDMLGQAAYCVLIKARDAMDRGAALSALLELKQPHSQSLRFISRELERQGVEPVHPDGFMNWLEALNRHAKLRFTNGSPELQGEDAFIFSQTVRRSSEFLLKNRTLNESQSLLARLDQVLAQAIAALPKNFDPAPLQNLRARVLEKSQNFVAAAGVYRELAVNSTAPQDRRRLADQMLKNFGFAIAPTTDITGQGATELVNDDAFLDACRVYQRMVPDGRQELSRCDLMMARKSLSQGQTADARQKLWQIVYAFPHAVEGRTAAERLVELSRNNPDELYMTTDKLLNLRDFQSGPWGDKLKDMRRQSSYQRIGSLPSRDDQVEAYFFFSQKEKGDPLADQALLQAVAIDRETDRLGRAMDRLEIWLQDYPTSPQAPTRILELVAIAEKSLQIKRARRYIRWTENRQWNGEQLDFIQQKTCLFDILENPLLALKSCERIGSHVAQGVPLRLRLARALAYSGYSDALNAYARDALIPRGDFSVDQKMEVLDLLRKTASITPARRDDVKTAMTNYYLEQTDSLGPISRRILGGLAWQAAHPSLDAFLALPIHGTRSDEWVSAVQAKKQAFDDLESLYNKVLQTKDPHWGSTALLDLALAAENFAENLGRVPDIEGLDRKKVLAQMASPVASWRAKAKSYAGSASKTLDKFGTLHLDNRRIIQEAHRLREDAVQFNDWIPSLIEAEPPSSRVSAWARWEEVAMELLDESSHPANKGMPTAPTLIKALDFAMEKRDFARVEWLNDSLQQVNDPKFQALGAWNQGRLHARLDDFDEAETNWLKSLRLDPTNLALQKQLGLLYARFGFFARAFNQLKTLEADPMVAITLVAMERQLDLNEQADRRCEVLLQDPQAPAEAYFNCSLLEFQNHRNATKGIAWMEEALHRSEGQALQEEARRQLTLMQTWKAKFQATR